MRESTYTWKVGDMECVAISDGSFPYPPQWFFANIPPGALEGELLARHLPADHVQGTYTCLLIKTGGKNVLLDTGAGNMVATTGALVSNLQEAGVSAGDIGVVILTHAHPDHIGGAVDAEGRPAFPNARYVMFKDEWEFWTAEHVDLDAMEVPEEIKAALILGTVRRCLPPLKPQIELLEGEVEIAPGIWSIRAPGHTPGHMAVGISSGRDSVLHIADAVLHPLHLEHPAWRNAFDLVQGQAAETRRRILDRAATDRTKTVAYHFPFPTLGHIVSRGAAWAWEPIT